MNDITPIAPSSALTVTSALVPAVVFAPGGVDDVLARVKAEAQAEARDLDVSTPAGRAAIKSLAYKVSRSKSLLDKMGKELGEENYRAWKRITAERAKIESELDALRDAIRQPVTDFENAEKDRIEGHETALRHIADLAHFDSDEPDIAVVEARIGAVRRLIADRDWQEFAKRAEDTEAATAGRLLQLRDRLVALHAERAEAERQRQEQERIRAEQEARERREREERIAAEAAERAKREAEAKAQAEAEAAERERQRLLAEAEERRQRELREAEQRRQREAQEAADRARREQEAIEAKARAEREAAEAARQAERRARQEAEERAAQAERDRLAAERRAEQAAAAERKRLDDEEAQRNRERDAREADRRHRAKLHGEARDDLIFGKIAGITEEIATAVVVAIARGEVRHTRISY